MLDDIYQALLLWRLITVMPLKWIIPFKSEERISDVSGKLSPADVMVLTCFWLKCSWWSSQRSVDFFLFVCFRFFFPFHLISTQHRSQVFWRYVLKSHLTFSWALVCFHAVCMRGDHQLNYNAKCSFKLPCWASLRSAWVQC